MKGASAEPSAKITKPPINKLKMIIGNSQNFLRAFMKRHNSLSKSIVKLVNLIDDCCH